MPRGMGRSGIGACIIASHFRHEHAGRTWRSTSKYPGKTRTGRQWVYLRDERPHAGTAPPAVLYRYTPDRKGEHCHAELARFVGWLHADGYAGFGRLYEIQGARSDTGLLQGPPRVAEVACWAH